MENLTDEELIDHLRSNYDKLKEMGKEAYKENRPMSWSHGTPAVYATKMGQIVKILQSRGITVTDLINNHKIGNINVYGRLDLSGGKNRGKSHKKRKSHKRHKSHKKRKSRNKSHRRKRR